MKTATEGGPVSEPRIVCDPNILFGKPVIAGTRISVELLLEKLGAGEKIEDILIDYPHLTREDIQAALRFAASAIRSDVVYPFTTASA
jgi:uncharacterized protein (DUF433 family)